MNFEDHWPVTEKALAREAASLGEVLERLHGRIPPVLIGEREWERVLERAGPLPPAMAAFPFGFELPLHSSLPTADLGVSVVGGGRTAAFFEEAARSEDADSAAQGVARLLAETKPEESRLRRVAGRKMLLEYDIDATGQGAHPEPGLFLYPAEGVLLGDRSRDRLGDLQVVVEAIAAATGRDLDDAKREQVEGVYLAMETDASIRAVGAFPSRGSGLRLAITGFRKATGAVAFLERAAWPGHHGAVADILSRFEQRGAFHHLGIHFDIEGSGVGQTLGLSFYAQEGQWLKDIRHWLPLVDGIGADGLAVREKLSALAEDWSGTETLIGNSGSFVHVRGLHHIKLSITDARIEQVKAYVFMLLLGV